MSDRHEMPHSGTVPGRYQVNIIGALLVPGELLLDELLLLTHRGAFGAR